MADSTTGELPVIQIGQLPSAASVYDEFLMPGEFQGGAVRISGRQLKNYAIASVESYSSTAKQSAESAEKARAAAASSEGRAAASASSASRDAGIAAQDRAYIAGMTVTYETLGPGESAKITKTAVGQSFNLHFGIPTGANGVALAAEGYYAFNLEDGHLVAYSDGGAALNFELDGTHLYMNIN